MEKSQIDHPEVESDCWLHRWPLPVRYDQCTDWLAVVLQSETWVTWRVKNVSFPRAYLEPWPLMCLLQIVQSESSFQNPAEGLRLLEKKQAVKLQFKLTKTESQLRDGQYKWLYPGGSGPSWDARSSSSSHKLRLNQSWRPSTTRAQSSNNNNNNNKLRQRMNDFNVSLHDLLIWDSVMDSWTRGFDFVPQMLETEKHRQQPSLF